jgi:hypothetical protein
VPALPSNQASWSFEARYSLSPIRRCAAQT